MAPVFLLIGILSMRFFVKRIKISWYEGLYYFLVFQVEVFVSYLMVQSTKFTHTTT